MKIEFIIIKTSEFFLVIKHASVGGFEIDRIPVKGYFYEKMVKNGGIQKRVLDQDLRLE